MWRHKYSHLFLRLSAALIVILLLVCCLFQRALATPVESESDTASSEFSEHFSHFTASGNDSISEAQSISEASDKLSKDFTLSGILSRFAQSIKQTLESYFKYFSGLTAIIIICGIACVVKDKNGSGEIAEYAGNLAVCTYCMSLVGALCENVELICREICTFLLAALPSVTALYASSVGPMSASASHGGTLTALNLIQSAVTLIIIPGTKAVLVLSCVSAITRFMDMSGFCALVKSALMWVLGILISMISAVMYFQTSLSASADGLAVRGMRFAAQSAIPIVGGVISESMRVVTESLRLVKSVCGVTGIFTIVTLILPPLALIVTHRICFGFTSALAGMLGINKSRTFLKEMQGVVNLLFACLAAVVFVGIIILGMFVKSVA